MTTFSKNLQAGILTGVLALFSSCKEKEAYYSFNDFEKVPKTDVHLHINTTNPMYMELAEQNNFRVVSPNVDSSIPVDQQLDTSIVIAGLWPERFAFLGTFSVDSFGTQGFAENTILRIKKCMDAGACGIKVWKNIGMVLKNKDGKYVMVDDPALDPVFDYLENNNIPVAGHLGEPRNCWLPFDQMTDSANARYYRGHPEYHMFLHPEAPSYEDQLIARDNLLRKHPRLDFTGSHLGSMEWSVDEISKRLDSFPGFKVDVSARMAHLQYQSIADREKVRKFMIKYSDRILYGTDITISRGAKVNNLVDRWRSNWIYLATDSVINIQNVGDGVKGLKLPKRVIDRIYNQNADYLFSKKQK